MALTVIAGTVPEPRNEGRRRFPSRTLHLIDIENLAGSPVPEAALVRHLWDVYAERVGIGAMDQIVVACSHKAFKSVGHCWPGARYLVRSGPDGADRELLDVLYHENVASRFRHVAIASGDGIFVWPARDLSKFGCSVTVVSRWSGLSARLAAAAERVIFLDKPGGTPAAAAANLQNAA
jgi:hypothetical protein